VLLWFEDCEVQKQILCGDDNKKSSKSNYKSKNNDKRQS